MSPFTTLFMLVVLVTKHFADCFNLPYYFQAMLLIKNFFYDELLEAN
jgi:hypothetical protein